MKKIGFIGTGNMGGALAAAAVKSGHSIFLTDKDTKKAEALAAESSATAVSTEELISSCDMVFLGVKPQILPAVAKEIGGLVAHRGGELCLVSMAAGVTLTQLDGFFPDTKIIRIMPNTPASVGEGVILYALGQGAG